MIRAANLEAAGVPHAFATREDAEAALRAAVGARPDRFFLATQVHGRTVHTVRAADRPADVLELEADVLVASGSGDTVGVVTADCVPVLLADQESGRVAAVHVGWRGAVAGVLDAALDSLFAAGTTPRRLIAAIGPHIRDCCFEVGEDVATRLEAIGALVSRARARPHASLARIFLTTLAARGVPIVEDVGGCTRCEPDRFHSYRRDGEKAGRQLSLVRAR